MLGKKFVDKSELNNGLFMNMEIEEEYQPSYYFPFLRRFMEWLGLA